MIQGAHSKEVKYMPCMDCSHTRLNDASNFGDAKATVQEEDGMQHNNLDLTLPSTN